MARLTGFIVAVVVVLAAYQVLFHLPREPVATVFQYQPAAVADPVPEAVKVAVVNPVEVPAPEPVDVPVTEPVVVPATAPVEPADIDAVAVPATEPVAEPVQDVMVTVEKPDLQWQAVWQAFRAERSAQGFADRLQRLTGLEHRVMKMSPGRYQVVVGYATEADRVAALTRIEKATGLNLAAHHNDAA